MQEAYSKKMVDLQMAEARLILQSTSSMFDSLTQVAAATAGKQSGLYQAMFATSKAFAIADATVKIAQGIAAAAANPFPYNIAAMASVAAATASIVSSIQAVQLEFGGEKAEGGRVMPGKSFLVGERGPELFSPASMGNIIPNDQLGGRSIKVIVNNYTDATAQVSERMDGQERIVEVVVRRVKNEIATEVRDGRGLVNRAMTDSFNLRRGA